MLKLFLPVFFPSWRFFSSIGPSPRIYYAFLQRENAEPVKWLEFRPCPEKISFTHLLFNLFHNPRWNETLYLNTCAERLFEGYSEMREREIMQRIMNAVQLNEITVEPGATYITYQLCAVMREGQVITQQTTFTARPVLIHGVRAGHQG